ncbi:MAG TPA: glycosyltransferase family 2 protein [Candidatus Didemnitutus sp.]|nr:glycosyltransferase family 2 protein [Candidatus Didemnitutus sp.]
MRPDSQRPEESSAASFSAARSVWSGPEVADPPRISIVTPNYNYGHFLESTLRSVLDQSYPNLEYIVVDGGSTDSSAKILQRYTDRLAHCETDLTRGQYKAITRGFTKATGEILAWLNSDDMYCPWTLWTVADIFRRFPEVEWISTLQPGFWDWTGACLGFGQIRGFAKEAFLDGANLPAAGHPRTFVPGQYRKCIQQESTFWRRSLWEKAGGFVSQDYGLAGDFELWCRFYRHAELWGVNLPLAGFRFQHQQQTTQAQKYSDQCAGVLEEFRAEARWQPALARRIGYRFRPWDLPLLRRATKNSLAYAGKRVSRSSTETAAAGWVRESHPFHY